MYKGDLSSKSAAGKGKGGRSGGGTKNEIEVGDHLFEFFHAENRKNFYHAYNDDKNPIRTDPFDTGLDRVRDVWGWEKLTYPATPKEQRDDQHAQKESAHWDTQLMHVEEEFSRVT